MRAAGRATRRLPGAWPRWRALPVTERRTTLHALVVMLLVEATFRWVRIPTLAGWLGVQVDGRAGGGSVAAGPDPAAGSDPVAGPDPAVEPDVGAVPGPAAEPDLAAAPDPELRARRRAALRATGRIIDRWPFGAGPCLRESLVLGHLLRAEEPVLRFGVARRGGRLAAHAWIEIDGRPVNDPQGMVPLRTIAR